ncbi:MAG TPA: hypothetical protein VK116_00330 [Planctomycetota bacterium]|nr:hypothetical protein [Planctomycetota bacterium]
MHRFGRIVLLAIVFTATGSSTARAQIVIEGVEDEEVYGDSVTFEIVPEAGFEYEARLDGEPVPVGEAVLVDDVDYHELFVSRAPLAGGTAEEITIRFIVRARERGNSEWGLPPWVPYAPVPSATSEYAGATILALVPSTWIAGRDLPFGVRVVDPTGRRVGVNGRLELRIAGTSDVLGSTHLLRGVASGFVPAPASPGEITVELRAGPLVATTTVTLEEAPTFTELGGTLGTLELPAGSRVRFTSDATVGAGATLTIGAGSIVLLDPGVEVDVDGSIAFEGTREAPISVLPWDPERPWGGFRLGIAAARFDATFALFSGAGSDPNWFDAGGRGSSHRDEEPLIWLDNGARATLSDSFLFDIPGQLGHGEDSFLTLTRCVVQRAITTGQYNGGTVRVEDSALLEFPGFDAPFEDEDNDGLYLTGGAHFIHDSLIGWALDDGIDAGSGSAGSVEVLRSWIESTFHEGLAWSEGRDATVEDTVVMNCGQALECGFDDPDVTVRRCLLAASVIGARFGDNYDWDYEGFLRVFDSLILHNYRDVWGRTWDDFDYHDERMEISGNLLSVENPRHADNALWDPSAHAERLRPFLPTAPGPVGIAWALRDGKLDAEDLERGVPARLSSFSELVVEADWVLERDGVEIESGTITFDPGETVELVRFDPEIVAVDGTLRLALTAARNGEVTQPSDLTRVVERVLIAENASWRYRDIGIFPGASWADPDFDDSSWPEGPAELGFGDDDEATEIDGGPSNARHITSWFRHAFEIEDASRLETLTLHLRRDDGAVVYVNGVEAHRSNMPAGAIGPSTPAADTADDEEGFEVAELDPVLLVNGRNVIAVEVHQANATSSDLSFALELTATSSDAPGTILFRRGDSNRDGAVDLSDAVRILLGLFRGDTLPCEDAADVDDDGALSITDAIRLLDWLFRGGSTPAEPAAGPGVDPTEDSLSCAV